MARVTKCKCGKEWVSNSLYHVKKGETTHSEFACIPGRPKPKTKRGKELMAAITKEERVRAFVVAWLDEKNMEAKHFSRLHGLSTVEGWYEQADGAVEKPLTELVMRALRAFKA